MILHFICPDPDSFTSGGNLYNRWLIARLRERGWRVRQRAWPDLAAEAVADPEAIFFYDSLYFDTLQLRSIGRPAVFICHYLSGMEDVAGMEASAPATWKQLPLHFDHFLAPSALVRGLLTAKAGVDPQQVVLLPPLFEKIPAPVSKEREPPLIMLVANLVPVKGILPFLENLDRTLGERARLPRFELRIVGSLQLDQRYAAQVSSLIEKSLVLKERVRLCEPLANTDLLEWYRGSALLVSVSTFESFGMAIYEATMAGLPVVALSGGNVPNLVINGMNGLLFNDLSTLCEGLVDLLEQGDRRRRLRSYALRQRPDPTLESATGLDRLLALLHQYAKS